MQTGGDLQPYALMQFSNVTELHAHRTLYSSSHEAAPSAIVCM